MKNSYKNVITLLKHNKIYPVILLIFLLVLAYGKNILETETLQSSTEQCTNTISDSQDYHVIENQESYTKIENLISSKSGDYYRLKFVAQVIPDIRRTVSNSNEKGDSYNYLSSRYPYNVSIKLASRFGQEQQIATFSVKDPNIKYYEYVFKTDGNYQDALFAKENINDLERVSISNVSLSRLNIQNDSEISSLGATIQTVDNADDVPILPSGVPTDYVALSSPDQRVGEFFTATGERLSSVYLNLNAVGNGGLGDYTLSLYKEDSIAEGGAMASLKFQVADFSLYQYQGNFYRLPLASRLEKGSRYFLALSNKSAIINRSNYLKVAVWQGENAEKKVDLSAKSASSLPNNSYLFVESIQNAKSVSGETLANDSLIEDLGRGVGSFLYRSKSKASDIFVAEANPLASFDQVSKAVTFAGNQQGALVYKFNTIYPIQVLHFELKQAIGQYPRAVVKFSWDGTNWQEASTPNEGTSPYLFSQDVVSGASQSRHFYLSISSKDDPANYANPYIAIYDLKVGAKLIMEN